jgi:predicted nucleotidyltransferase
MRRRDQVAHLLKAHEAELRARGVEGLFLFGSVGRGDDHAESDVDLFFDHRPGLGLEVVAIQERVREIVAGAVDVTTRRSLHPLLRERIVAEAVRVF